MYIGKLYIISAPSGAGKTSLVKAMVESTAYVKVSVSHTTRAMRTGEENGVNYYYVDDNEFKQMVNKNLFLEHAKVFDNFYGTSSEWVKGRLQNGEDVILEIDWQGARQVRKLMPEAISIFIVPPSLMDLKQRLIDRASENPEVIKNRMLAAVNEISHHTEFDYLVVNDQFDHALRDLQTIVRSQRLSISWASYSKKELLEKLLYSSI